MRELWLRPNRRAILFGCVPPALAAIAGASLFAANRGSASQLMVVVAAILIAMGLGGGAVLLLQLRQPRVAFANGKVLFYLRRGRPIEVPVELVEAFFAGQGPAHLPVVSKQPQTVNLVARLSQRHKEWARQEVNPALGSWAEGYVTIRGSWCEPLDGELIRRLNRRLREVKTEATKATDE